MKLFFGKYKGQDISAVRADYLEWLLTLSNLNKGLRVAINKELAKRREDFEEWCEDVDAFTSEERKSIWIEWRKQGRI